MNYKLLILLLVILECNLCKAQGKSSSKDRFLLVVDVQPAFFVDQPWEQPATEMTRVINKIIETYSSEQVVYVLSTGKTLVISSKGFKVDTVPVPEIDPKLDVVNDYIFVKVSKGDAFSSSALTCFLESRHAKEIMIVGLLAEKCIFDSAIGGKERGFDITVVGNAVVGKSEKSKTKALARLSRKGISISNEMNLH